MLVPISNHDDLEDGAGVGAELVDVFLGDSDSEVVDARVADEYLTRDLIVVVRLSDGRELGLSVSEIR